MRRRNRKRKYSRELGNVSPSSRDYSRKKLPATGCNQSPRNCEICQWEEEHACRTRPFDDKAFEDTMMGATSQYSCLLSAYPLFQGFHSHSASGRRAIMSLIWTISILGIVPKSLLDATANGMKRHHSPTCYQNRCFD